MSDAAILILLAGFATLSWGLLALCDWLMGTTNERN
jgi:hypothetical protein